MVKKKAEPAPHDALEVIEPESENKTRGIDLLRVLGRSCLNASKKVQYATLLGQGWDRSLVCSELEISPVTGREWEYEEWFAPIYEESLQRAIAHHGDRIERMGPTAYANLEEALAEKKKWATLRVVDHIEGKPRTQSTVTVGVEKNLAELYTKMRQHATPRLPTPRQPQITVEKPHSASSGDPTDNPAGECNLSS